MEQKVLVMPYWLHLTGPYTQDLQSRSQSGDKAIQKGETIGTYHYHSNNQQYHRCRWSMNVLDRHLSGRNTEFFHLLLGPTEHR